MADAVDIANLNVNITVGGVEKTKKKIDNAKDAIKRVGNEAKKNSSKLGKFAESLKRIALYRTARWILKEIFQGFREGTTAMYQWSLMSGTTFAKSLNTMSTSLQNIKNSLAVAVAPIVENVIVPAVEKLSSILMSAGNAIARFLAILAGQKTYTIAVTGATKQYAKAVNDAKKSVLGFDELNVLNGMSGGGDNYDYGGAFKEVGLGELNGFETKASGAGEFIRKLMSDIKRDFAAIELLLGTSEFAVGTILLFSGANIPLGLGLMVAGALHSYHALSQNWEKIPNSVKEVLAEIEAACALGLFAIGAFIALSGANIPLGIGMMIAGASMGLAVFLQWDKLTNETKKSITSMVSVLSVGLLAVGAIFAFSGANIPLGIGFMLAGAAGLASAAALNWDSVKEKVGPAIKTVKDNASTFGLLALGCVLLFSGAGIPLGLGMIAKAGYDIATQIRPDWGASVLSGLREALNKIKNWWNEAVQPWIDRAKASFSDLFNVSGTTVRSGGFGTTSNSGSFGGKTVISATPRADGGFVNSGDMFLANENGSNEFIGRIGNRSAVANNDQIVEAVSLGVYNAVSSAMNGRNNNMSVKVFLDGREIKASQQRLARATG